MYVKRFTGPSVTEALRAARRELGEDTLLLGTRRTSSARGDATEITVAIERPEPVPAEARGPKPPQPARARASAAPAGSAVVAERKREIAAHDGRIRDLEARFDLLSRRIRDLRQEIEPAPATRRGDFVTPATPEIVAPLVACGLDAELAERAATALLLKEPEDGFAEQSFLEALAFELSLFVPARKPGPREGQRILVLVGPAGSGKTTTAAKLAARAAVLEGRDVALMGADDYRIGAFEQLREYASALSVPLEAVRDGASLSAALARNRERGLIVIDTPGIARRDGEQLLKLSRLLEAAPGAELRLVLPATTRARDLALAVSRFRALRPLEIVFSKMDETSCHGELLSVAARSACAVAGIANGRAIPEDYEETTPERLSEIVVRSAWSLLPWTETATGDA